jgi:hypothetical protein
LRIARTNDGEKLAILPRQQSHDGIDRIEARLGGMGRGRPFATRHGLHLVAQGSQILNPVFGHVDLRVSITATTVEPIPSWPNNRSTSSKKSSTGVSAP